MTDREQFDCLAWLLSESQKDGDGEAWKYKACADELQAARAAPAQPAQPAERVLMVRNPYGGKWFVAQANAWRADGNEYAWATIERIE